MKTPMWQRFWSKVQIQEAGCWKWRGYRMSNGYGQIRGEDSAVLAHRVAYELTHGPIPAGLDILHSCDNPGCCRPAHLRAGTVAENMHDAHIRRRSKKFTIQQCPQGHEYTPANTYTWGGSRKCRTCHYDQVMRHAANKRRAS